MDLRVAIARGLWSYNNLRSLPNNRACFRIKSQGILFPLSMCSYSAINNRFRHLLQNGSRFLLQGMCTSTPERFEKLDSFIRLWRNECLRVFHDRLIDEKDKDITQTLIRKLVEENFGRDEEFVLRDPCLFGDYRSALQVYALSGGGCNVFWFLKSSWFLK